MAYSLDLLRPYVETINDRCDQVLAQFYFTIDGGDVSLIEVIEEYYGVTFE